MLRKARETKRQIIESLNKRLLKEQTSTGGEMPTMGYSEDSNVKTLQDFNDDQDVTPMYPDENFADDDAKVLIYKDEIHIWKDGKHYMGNVG